jgi:hypothetical protein
LELPLENVLKPRTKITKAEREQRAEAATLAAKLDTENRANTRELKTSRLKELRMAKENAAAWAKQPR